MRKIEKNIDLSKYLTIKIPIKAEYFFIAKTVDDLIWAKKYSLEKKIPLFILGGGSNIVPFRKIIKGLVVKNDFQKLKIINEDLKKVFIQVSSGYYTSALSVKTMDMGYAGLEYFYGLPGTVGGALYMNSKWTKPLVYFGDKVISATLIDANGNIKRVTQDYFDFKYDYSILQKTKEIVVDVLLQLEKDEKEKIWQRALKVLEYRKKTQPFGVFTAGCFFKNIDEKIQKKKGLPTTSAGYLIDRCGLKGFKIGDFYVSEVHANFIINQGNGKLADLKKLLSIIKNTVKKKFEIELQEEVILI
jgi:UDP-N-acetylmuramate dehydrogenase